MNVNNNTLKEENKYLTEVKKVAKKFIKEIDVKITKEKQEIFELKKYIWNDCKSLSDLEYGNLLNDTENSVNENETNLVENTDSTDNIPSDDTIGGTAAPSDVSSIEQEDMSFSNILNILVITVGVVIILLAIAILIRLKS